MTGPRTNAGGTTSAGEARTARPLYFARDGAQLFGCYHPPSGRVQSQCGVLLCYPMGHEYIRCHRAFRVLSAQLSRAGFPVLRFDYSGVGNSSGGGAEPRLDHWLEDIRAAVQQLRELSGSRRVAAVGLRVGGTVAMMTGARCGDIDSLVLWQPVVSGRELLTGLENVHRAYLEDHRLARLYRPWTDGDAAVECLGFAYSNGLRADLQDVDLLKEARRPAQRVLVIDNTEGQEQADLTAHLEAIGVDVLYRHHPESQIWDADPYKMLLPHESSRAIRAWLSQVES